MTYRSCINALLFFLCSYLVGCSSHEEDPSRYSGPVGPDLNAPPVMTASGTFFDGRVQANLSLMEVGGGRIRRGKKGGWQSHQYGGGISREPGDTTEDEEKAHFVYHAIDPNGSPLPPAFLKLKLTNPSALETEKIEIVEVDSALGNFAVRPALFSLAPGESGEPDPMISKLGVTTPTIDVSIGLKIGGKTERRVLKLTPTDMPVATPPPASR